MIEQNEEVERKYLSKDSIDELVIKELLEAYQAQEIKDKKNCL